MSHDNHRDSQIPYRQASANTVKDDDNISTKRSSIIHRGNVSYNADGRIWQTVRTPSPSSDGTQTPQAQSSSRQQVQDNSAETYRSSMSTPIMRGSYPAPQAQTSVREQAASAQNDPAETYQSSMSTPIMRGSCPAPQAQTSVREQAPSAQNNSAETYHSSLSSYNYRGVEQTDCQPPVEQASPPVSPPPAEENNTAPIMIPPETVQNPANVSQPDTSSTLTDDDFFDPLRILRK